MTSDPRDAFLYSPVDERQRALLHSVLDLGLAFLDGEPRDGMVLRYASTTELVTEVARLGGMPETGCGDDELLRLLHLVAGRSVAQSDPRYLAFPDTGNSTAAVAAEVLSACLNQNLIAVDRSAPIASIVEVQLILWLRELVGYPTCPIENLRDLSWLGGMWTSGGNLSNHVAVLAALQTQVPGVRERGLRDLARRPVIVLAEGIDHFSYLGAAQALGLGRDGLVLTSPSRDYTTDVHAVADALRCPPQGAAPFMVVAVAGNCRTTGIDDLRALRRICDQHNVWLHVDACHGGSLLFSPKLRQQLAGIESADSVSLDPHKGLFVTYPSSYVLLRDPGHLAAFARYPAKVNDPECFDLGLLTPFYGSRGFESLKLWLLIRHLGRKGLQAVTEQRDQTYREMTRLLHRTGLFTFLHKPVFYRAAFVFCPPRLLPRLRTLAEDERRATAGRALVSHYSAAFVERLYETGRTVFDHFVLRDLDDVLGLGASYRYEVIGMAVGHPWLNDKVRTEIIQVVTEVGRHLAEEMQTDLSSLALRGSDGGEVETGVHGPAGW